jgi:hypothetical protein
MGSALHTHFRSIALIFRTASVWVPRTAVFDKALKNVLCLPGETVEECVVRAILFSS